MEPEDTGQGFDSGSAQGDSGTGTNPAWDSLLSQIPEDLHSQVQPVLQDWDKGVQDRFTKVHDEYAPYKPYKEAGISGEDINLALGLYTAIQERPEEVMAAMKEWQEVDNAGGSSDNGASDSQGQQSQTDFDLTKHPEFQKLNQASQQMAQILLEQRQEEEAKAADAAFDKELQEAKAKHGDFNEELVVAVALQEDISLEDAIGKLEAYNQSIRKTPPAPKLLGSGGNFPNSNQVDPTKMNSKDTKDYVAHYLAMAKGQQ